LVAALSLMLVCPAPGQRYENGSPRITDISITTPGVGDLAHPLNIQQIMGTYELSKSVTDVRLELLFYQRGELVETVESLALSTTLATDKGTFALQFVDLDYLPLGRAESRHHRLHAQLADGHERTVTFKVDLPKSTFDVSTRFNTARFDPAVGQPNQAPLFAIIGGSGSASWFASTPADLVRRNADADVLIGVLAFE
jgi:hypothetical protein